jgi:hypothetical protein
MTFPLFLMAIFHLDTLYICTSGGIYTLTFGKIEQCDHLQVMHVFLKLFPVLRITNTEVSEYMGPYQ